MALPPIAEALAGRVVTNAREVLGDRLRYCAVHGSAATGDVIADYSDLDLYLAVDDVDALTVDVAVRLRERLSRLDTQSFSRVQATLVRWATPEHLLVPGAFISVWGTHPPAGSVQSDEQLREAGLTWLRQLPSLFRSDVLDWAFATIAVERQARLALTRLKPAIRAIVVASGDEPGSVWSASWDQLIDATTSIDESLGAETFAVVAAARAGGRSAAPEVGTTALRALKLIVDRHV